MRVAIGQIPIVMGDKASNLSALASAVAGAAAAGCDLVVLPECPLVGWLHPTAVTAAETIPGPYTHLLGSLARRHDIHIVSGIEERAGTRLHNSAVLIDRNGVQRAHHRKINELAIGQTMYTTGRALGVIDLNGVPVALSICADSWIPTITDCLWIMGARVVLSPCAWAIEPGGESANIDWIRKCYAAHTAGRDLHIVAANSVGVIDHGPWSGRVVHGDSLIIGPNGTLNAQGRRNASDLPVVDLA